MSLNTRKKVAVAVIGAFAQSIHRTGDEVLKTRGERVIKSAKAAQADLVRKLDLEKDSLHDKLEAMLDQSPDNRYSLKVGKEFNADEFTVEFQKLSVELANKTIEHQIAEQNFEFLYGK